MIHNILDFFINVMLFILNILTVLLCRVGIWIEVIVEKVFDGMDGFFVFVFETMPNNISLCYRFQRIFYPAKCKCDLDLKIFSTEIKHWLDDNIGKHRWKVIKRGSDLCEIKYHLCFRRKTDVMAFKLRWL